MHPLFKICGVWRITIYAHILNLNIKLLISLKYYSWLPIPQLMFQNFGLALHVFLFILKSRYSLFRRLIIFSLTWEHGK